MAIRKIVVLGEDEVLRKRARRVDVFDKRLRTLLELRYINCMTFEQIAVAMSYSYKQVCRLHGKALLEIRCP